MGSVPNVLARGLITQSTCTVGVVAPDLTDYVLAQFVVGAEREARPRRHCVIMGTIDTAGDEGERYLRMLIDRRVDGILLAAPQLER